MDSQSNNVQPAAENVELQAKLQVGIDQLERGEYIEIKGEEGLRDFFEDMQQRVEERNAGQPLQPQDAELLEIRRLIAEADAEYERGEYIEISTLEEHNALFDEMKAELEEFIAQLER